MKHLNERSRAGKALFCALAALAGLAASAAPVLGTIGTDFAAARAAAEAGHVPLAVVWGNTDCPKCNTLSRALESADVRNWLAGHPIYVVHKHEAYGSTSADYLAAKAWIASIGRLTAYPFVGLYWAKADGTVVKTAFSGLVNKMPVTAPRNNLAKQFANTLDQFFGGYTGGGAPAEPSGPAADAAFVAGETAGNRLEATPATRTVYVPLRREKADADETSTLVAIALGTGEEQRIAVAWKAGETRVNAPVRMPSRVTVGRKMTLTLVGANGAVSAKSSIAFVKEPENAPKNPHWIGVHTAKTLPYGEWTMDFDVAREKVATQGGHLVAMFGGPLWCPNCAAIEDDVFDTRAFRTWAKREKVVLVHFDQGQASSPSTPQGTMTGRLLSHVPSRTGLSGSAYMARMGIDSLSDEVTAAIDRVTTLTAQWLPYGSTAARLSNPAVLLLDKTGTRVQARFVRQRDGASMDLKENLARLADLISLEGHDERVSNGAVTPLKLAAGARATATFHVNARTFAWRLTGLADGDCVQARVSSGDRTARAVELALTLVKDGATVATLATGRNGLRTEKTLSELWPEGVAADAVPCLEATAFGSDDDAASQFFGNACAFTATVSLYGVSGGAAAPEPIGTFTKAELKALNPNLYARQSASVPLYAEAEGGKRLAGIAAVSATSANRVTVKLTGEETLSFRGQWEEVNPLSGAVGTTLSASGRSLAVSMDADGVFAVTLDGAATGAAAAFAQGAAFEGAYTVTLVPEAGDEGVGRLTVKISRAGRASVSGVVGRGAKLSLSAALVANADGSATLPLYRRTPAGVLSAALRIAPNAAATWGSVGEMATVGAADGCRAAWEGRDGSLLAYEVYGGYWKSGTTPQAACALFDLPATLDVSLGGERIATVTAAGNGFAFERGGALKTLSVTRSSGALNGRLMVALEDGRRVTATVAGVLLPGWHDCGCTAEPVVERPFASGMAFCTVGGVSYAWPIAFTHKED